MVKILDGYYNALTKQGTTKDKVLAGRPVASTWTREQRALWVETSWLAGRVVNKIVEDALSGGVVIEVPDDKEASAGVVEYLQLRGLHNVLAMGAKWARTFGGAGILLGAQDGATDYAEPLDENRIASISYLTALDAHDLTVVAYETDITKRGYGWPLRYSLASQTATVVGLHASRVLRFEGVMADRPARRTARVMCGGWGESVLSQVQNDISGFEQSWGGVWQALAEHSVGVYGISNLHARFDAGEGDDVTERMQQLDTGKSLFQSMLLDKENETYQRVAINLQGVPELMQRAMVQISAGANCPVSELFGQAASGLSATGEGDARKWQQTVDTYRTDVLTPVVHRLAELAFLAKDGPTRGVPPTKFKVSWPPLYTPAAAEQATTRKTMAETDQIYMGLGVLTAKDVAVSRFGGRAYSVDTTVDVGAIADEVAAPEGDNGQP